MTVGKASALAAGFVGALALGVAIGPTVHDRLSKSSTEDTAVTESAPAPTTSAPARATKRAAAPAPAKDRDRRATASEPLVPAGPPGSVQSVAVAVWEPDLRERVQSVLNKGTKLELAAADFRTAEEFVTVAHVARNTSVPFMVLKHRVLNEGRTLSEAIHEAKPDLDAKAEVARAREAAQADLAAD